MDVEKSFRPKPSALHIPSEMVNWRFIPLIAAVVLLGGCLKPRGNVTWLRFSIWGSIDQQKAEREIVRRFEAEHPDIKVEILSLGTRYAEKIQAMMVGDIAPDLILVNVTNYCDWARRARLRDVTSEVAAIEKESPMMPLPRQAFRIDGHFYGMPVSCHGYVAYCNLDAFKKAGVYMPPGGLTWEWLEQVGPKFAGRLGQPNAPTEYLMMMPDAFTLLSCFGGTLLDDPYHPTRPTVDSVETRAAMTYLRRMVKSGLALPWIYGADPANPDFPAQLFRQGRLAIHFSGRWDTPKFKDKVAFNWDVLPMPAGPAGSIAAHGGSVLSINPKTREKKAALTFLHFYASRTGSELGMEGGRVVPVFRDVAFGKKFLSLRPPASMRVFSETMENGSSRFIVYAPGAEELLRLFWGRMEQVTSEPDLPLDTIVHSLTEA